MSKKKRAISYFRVSTARQGRSGLGLDAQREAVRGFLNDDAWEVLGEFTEVESGKRADRPQLEAALAACRLQGAVMVIAKLDRLARNVAFVSALMDSGVEFVCADLPSANRLTVHILSAMAEYEARAISERTKASLAQAKARGVKLGGDRGNIQAIAHLGVAASAKVRTERAQRRASDLRPIITRIEHEGTSSLQGIAHALNMMSVTAPRGGEWSAGQVARVKRALIVNC
jgi:DNA invertase Pin-like site-specific DNA recombinase